MQRTNTIFPDVYVFSPKVFGDSRGFFFEAWRKDIFQNAGIDYDFVQDNQSSSRQGVLRGLHYQITRPQGKLVRVLSGCVYDVVVDLRRSSSTFGKWLGIELSDENRQMLWVPPGFAHGFYVLSERAEFIYKCTEYYAPDNERIIRFNDPEIGIKWPLLDKVPTILSAKDEQGVPFAKADLFD